MEFFDKMTYTQHAFVQQLNKKKSASRSWECTGVFTECVNVCCKRASKNGFSAHSRREIEYKFQVEKATSVDGCITSRSKE